MHGEDEKSNIEVSAAAEQNGNLAPPKSASTDKWRNKDQGTSAAIPQRDKNIGRILVRNYIIIQTVIPSQQSTV
jgi:hypothetical protein